MTQEEAKKRESILGIVGCKYTNGGMEKFGGLSFGRFERLISEGFLTLRDKDTYSKFLRFMKKNTLFKAYGYAVAPDRQDTRIVIEGIEAYPHFSLPEDIKNEFKNEFADASELVMEDKKFSCFYKYE